MLSSVTSSSTSPTTDSKAMLNNVGVKASSYLKPVPTENSENSALNLILHFECCTHAFTSLTSFAGIQS